MIAIKIIIVKDDVAAVVLQHMFARRCTQIDRVTWIWHHHRWRINRTWHVQCQIAIALFAQSLITQFRIYGRCWRKFVHNSLSPTSFAYNISCFSVCYVSTGRNNIIYTNNNENVILSSNRNKIWNVKCDSTKNGENKKVFSLKIKSFCVTLSHLSLEHLYSNGLDKFPLSSVPLCVTTRGNNKARN
jgi:hypothetical protein